jgi:hypothetical protein
MSIPERSMSIPERDDVVLLLAAGVPAERIKTLNRLEAFLFYGRLTGDSEVTKRAVAGMPYAGYPPSVIPSWTSLEIIRAMTAAERAELLVRVGARGL